MNVTKLENLEGERIKFVALSLEDSVAIHEFASNEDVSRFIGWPLTQTLEETEKYIKKMLNNVEKGSHIYANVILKETHKLIGTVMFFDFDKVANHAEVGYVFHQDHWGNGYGSEAMKILNDYAFNELKLHKLHARVTSGNIGSCKVLEKNGFELEGTFRDYFYIDNTYYDCICYGKLKYLKA